ncbi:MAG: 30S ribosomal protein S12 methylthiotransferase RimO [Lachnospiraceae bacterium]|nr:30S ribosomal protein S12 methylthiotransferase RimO [Lachnospiraceae bacterium]
MTEVLFISLGCDKNRVDSEVMLASLSARGYSITDDETLAKAAVVNTCCFIHDAKEESVNEILALASLKEAGSLQAIIVTGCLADRYYDEIAREIPEVDAVVKIAEEESLADVLDACLSGESAGTGALTHSETDTPLLNIPNESVYPSPMTHSPMTHSPMTHPSPQSRMLTTTTGYAYLKIAEGCDKHCTYCIIPKVRGAYRSVPEEALVAEATFLAAQSVKELILAAQETTLYGVDLYGEKRLPALLKKLCAIDGIRWIRLLYCYPEEITDELIDVMKREKKILHYLDMPVQSGSDRILKLMGRKTDVKSIRAVVQKLREAMPDVCLRTTLITGFPTETAQDVNETAAFIEELKFDRLGIFTYSAEEDTPAYEMKEQVKEVTKKMRRTRLMKLQQKIAFEAAKKMVGTTLDAIIEGYLPEEDCYVCRTYKDMPDIDGMLFLQLPLDASRDLLSGTIVQVRVTEAREYDLIGELAEAL